MEELLRKVCHKVNPIASKTLDEADCRVVRKRYRTILTQDVRELPEIPLRPKGTGGRVARPDAHNLHKRLENHRKFVLRFMKGPDVSFNNNTGEQKIRMVKVKIKVSGCFRTMLHATAWCRSSSYLSSMATLRYNPLVVIQIALARKAVDMIKLHDDQSDSKIGASSCSRP